MSNVTNKSENNRNEETFIPIKPKKKDKKEKTTKKIIVDKYPNLATITISKEEPKVSKSILFNKKALETLNLSAGGLDKIELTKGYFPSNKERIRLFVNSTNKDSFMFVNNKGNGIKIKTSPIKFTTQKMQSSSIHSILLEHSNNNLVNEAKTFVITKRYNNGESDVFLLEPIDEYLERTQQLVINSESSENNTASDNQETTITNQ